MVRPYYDIDDIRVFKKDIPESELVWHRDEEHRVVRVISGEGWEFQYENNLPFEMKLEEIFYIPKMMYHRVYKKGNTDLVLRILRSNGPGND